MGDADLVVVRTFMNRQEAELAGQPHGLGLISMKERARLAHGRLSIASRLGEGTTVTAGIPFEQHA